MNNEVRSLSNRAGAVRIGVLSEPLVCDAETAAWFG